ncbi:MAG: PAS domain S-box protein [Ignavibacteriales bacterium]|nr:PAS domain S-box protein [Ignavibacteriales bacterium]
MKEDITTITNEYAEALQEYLGGAGEAALQRAYELGRRAIADGVGGLELARIYEDALLQFLGRESTPTLDRESLKLASNFFVESLSPLEMIYRGFQEALSTLRISEERYRTLVETARDVIYTLSMDGTITSLNPAFEHLTGWSRSDWLGKPFVPLVHPDDLSFALTTFEQLLLGKTPKIFELRILTKAGHYMIAEFTKTPQVRDGNIIGALGIARDITDRKKAEEKLHQSEEQFRLIAENVDDLIVMLDTEGKRIYNSPSYKTILGDPAQLRGTTAFTDIHPEDRERIQRLFRQTVETGIGRRAQFRFLLKDGSIRYIESQGSVVKDANQKPEKVIVVSRDVTERIQADEKIKKSERQLAAAQQIAHIGSWEWDIAADKITWSDELCRIYGVNPVGFKATYEDFLQRVHPDDREKVNAGVTHGFQTKEPFRFEHRIILPDGTVRTLEGRGEVITDTSGKPVRMMGTGEDITDQKKASEALRVLARKVIEAQEEERQRIARELHDDVCQRLTGMRFSLEDVETDLAPKNRKGRQRLKNSLKQIDQLIKEVRRMSWNLRPASLDDFGLAVALRRLCEEHQKIYKTKVGFATHGEIAKHSDTQIETAFYRIVQEALSNIGKHARAKNISVLLSQLNGSLILEVEDNGKGFSRKNLKTARTTGHGLGLVSMKERSELLGGIFQVESTPNKGTKIHVEIPLQPIAE